MKLKTALLGAAALTAIAQLAYADGHEGPRGRDGEVKIIYWQAPSILNAYLSGSTKDSEAASLVIEPLARYDEVKTVRAEIYGCNDLRLGSLRRRTIVRNRRWFVHSDSG